MPRTIRQLSEHEITWIDGYTQGNSKLFNAIVLGHFEGLGARAVERAVGVPRTTVQRVVTEFKPRYEDWQARRAAMKTPPSRSGLVDSDA